MSEFKELPVSESPEMQFVMSADLSTPGPQNEAFSSIITALRLVISYCY
ncbi:hypothetical protein BV898_17322, partial [Hypsibius exemplaris]